jgi:uncharacterized protein (TIGR02266 family)
LTRTKPDFAVCRALFSAKLRGVRSRRTGAVGGGAGGGFEKEASLRRQQRIAYQTKVRLRAQGREHSVVARVQNLSSSGIFVTAADIPEAGTEVRCKLTLAGEARTLRGRVAWVRPASPSTPLKSPGAGIEFLDLGAEEADLLARVAEPAGEGDRQPVDVWFEGMKAPIRCQAVVVGDGVQLATRLPFMRLNSSVRVSFGQGEDADVRAGTLESVSLEPSSNDGIPNLQLNVVMATLDHALGTIEVAGAERGKTPAEGVLFAQPSTVIDPAVIAPVPESAPATGTLRGAVFPEVSAVARAQEAEAASRSAKEPSSPPPSLPDRERTQRIVMSTRLAQLRGPVPKAPPPAQRAAPRRSWPAAAVGFLGGATLVAIMAVGLARRGAAVAPAPLAISTPAPRPAAIEPAPAPSRATIEPLASPAVAARKPVAMPAAAPSRATIEPLAPPAVAARKPVAMPAAAPSRATIEPLAPPAPATKPAATAALPASGALPAGGAAMDAGTAVAPGLSVDLKGGTATALLAVSGSLAGAEPYELANPAGLGLKLPRARLRLAPGIHNGGGPFGRLIVQRKGAGSLVRLHFNPRVWASEVRFERETVRLILRRK